VLGYPATDEKKRSRGALYGTGKTKADIALSLDPANPFAKFILGELLTDEGVKEHKYTRPEKFQKAESFLAEAKAAAPYGEAQYEALYARSLAGQGRYKDATALLSSVRSTRKLYYLVEWVQGEALYNQSLLGKDRSLLELALQHLTKARDLRSCGARADAIRDLSTVVAIELSKHPPAAPFVNAGPDASDALIEKRTAAPGKVKLESEIAIPNPDSPTLAPSSRTPEQEPLKPEQGAMQLAPTLAKPSLIPIKLDGEPTRTESALQNLGAVATKPDSSRPSSDAVVSRPARALQASAKIEPKPVCRMWDKLRPDQLSPWVEDNPAKAALLPAFDASH
jgi:tetratricopeptide (TPR) repeat protein